tara:strand:+ start:255 stop:404 length:150 start_codon:yes stop_codon:yes gene_type:complete
MSDGEDSKALEGTGLHKLTSGLTMDKLCKICLIILLGVEITGSDMLLLV